MSDSVAPLVRLQDARLVGFGQTLLDTTTWEVRKGRVTVIIGPAGTGKSALLRALAGRCAGFELSGTWLFDGDRYSKATEDRMCLVPQGVNGDRRSLRELVSTVGATKAEVILLDEPDHGLNQLELEQLVEHISKWKQHSTLLLITHNLEFARRVGDDAALLCASKLWAAGELNQVFNEPPNELTRRFLEQGNCWPGPTPPELPQHFKWLLPNQLAGMGKPGLMRSVEEDLEAIARAGITQLVTLTKQAFPATMLSGFGIEGRHFPIQDMGIPGEGGTIRLCRGIERALAHNGRVAVHCHAGLGRTGTILAAYLICRGQDSEAAITTVRSVNPKFIQSDAQLEFLRRFKG